VYRNKVLWIQVRNLKKSSKQLNITQTWIHFHVMMRTDFSYLVYTWLQPNKLTIMWVMFDPTTLIGTTQNLTIQKYCMLLLAINTIYSEIIFFMTFLKFYQKRFETLSIYHFRVRVMVLNTTFNNISVISWHSILLVEETGVLGENHQPA
jgi:hypothetical protein